MQAPCVCSQPESSVIAVLAFCVSVLTLVLQFLRVRGARITVLASEFSTRQQARLITYDALPANVRNTFPRLPNASPYYALLEIPIANEGDRAGYASVVGVSSPPTNRIEASFYNHAVVPAYGIAVHQLLLSNFSADDEGKSFELRVKLELAGLPSWMRSAQHTLRVQERMVVINLVLRGRTDEALGASQVDAPW